MELEILPGEGLGPFVLGESMPVCLHRIKSMSGKFRQAEIFFHPIDPLSTDTIVHLPDAALRLRFHSQTQALHAIECYDCTRNTLQMSNVALCGADVPLTLANIYRLMGPTFPRKQFELPLQFRSYSTQSFPAVDFDDVDLAAVQYAGVAVIFPESNQSDDHDQVPLKAARLLVFSGTDLQNRTDPVPMFQRDLPATRGALYQQPVLVVPGRGINLTAQHRWITFNMHAQDVMADLGPPDRVFRTTPKRSSIANSSPFLTGKKSASSSPQLSGAGSSKLASPAMPALSLNAAKSQLSPVSVPDWSPLSFPVSGVAAEPVVQVNAVAPVNASEKQPLAGDYANADEGFQDYIWNYFWHGFDICFDGCTHMVKKLILHTNFPPAHDFNMYQKCHFRFLFPVETAAQSSSPQFARSSLGADSHWQEIKAHFGEPSRPLINPFGGAPSTAPVPFQDPSTSIEKSIRLDGSMLYAYPHLVFEVLRNNYLASVQILP